MRLCVAQPILIPVRLLINALLQFIHPTKVVDFEVDADAAIKETCRIVDREILNSTFDNLVYDHVASFVVRHSYFEEVVWIMVRH